MRSDVLVGLCVGCIGNPAQIAGWVSEAGQKLAFDKDGLAFCSKANKYYRLENSLVREIG